MIQKISSLYAYIFSRKFLQTTNDAILRAALKARGYNNFQDGKMSGEDFFIKKILASRNPELCIDIGANVGEYSETILNYTGSKVICFEPHPLTFNSLNERLARYGNRVITENTGVGNLNGICKIHYNPDAMTHASFSKEIENVSYVDNKMEEDVRVVTLDSYCEKNSIEHIDLIKIDTEGFESEVILGALNCIQNIKPKLIQIEFNWHQLFRDTTLHYFARHLKEYTVYQLIPFGWIERDPKEPLTNTYQYSNFIFALR